MGLGGDGSGRFRPHEGEFDAIDTSSVGVVVLRARAARTGQFGGRSIPANGDVSKAGTSDGTYLAASPWPMRLAARVAWKVTPP
jgi:hypothetical protein